MLGSGSDTNVIVFRMGAMPGSQRRERSSLDVWILGSFRFFNLFSIVVFSIFDRGFGLGEENLVLLSSSNSATLEHFNIVGGGSEYVECE